MKGDTVPSFAILTDEPNELVAPFHDRMAVVLDDPEAWLETDTTLDNIKPLGPEAFEVRSVNRGEQADREKSRRDRRQGEDPPRDSPAKDILVLSPAKGLEHFLVRCRRLGIVREFRLIVIGTCQHVHQFMEGIESSFLRIMDRRLDAVIARNENRVRGAHECASLFCRLAFMRQAFAPAFCPFVPGGRICEKHADVGVPALITCRVARFRPCA